MSGVGGAVGGVGHSDSTASEEVRRFGCAINHCKKKCSLMQLQFSGQFCV